MGKAHRLTRALNDITPFTDDDIPRTAAQRKSILNLTLRQAEKIRSLTLLNGNLRTTQFTLRQRIQELEEENQILKTAVIVEASAIKVDARVRELRRNKLNLTTSEPRLRAQNIRSDDIPF